MQRAFGPASVQERQILPFFGPGVVLISSMEVADLVRGIFERRVPNPPADPCHRLFPIPLQLDLRRPEKRHGEKAGQAGSLSVEADVHRESLHQVLTVVAAVERARAEKERY